MKLDWMITRGGDEAAAGRADELHVWVDSHRIYGLCRVDRGVWF